MNSFMAKNRRTEIKILKELIIKKNNLKLKKKENEKHRSHRRRELGNRPNENALQ